MTSLTPAHAKRVWILATARSNRLEPRIFQPIQVLALWRSHPKKGVWKTMDFILNCYFSITRSAFLRNVTLPISLRWKVSELQYRMIWEGRKMIIYLSSREKKRGTYKTEASMITYGKSRFSQSRTDTLWHLLDHTPIPNAPKLWADTLILKRFKRSSPRT